MARFFISKPGRTNLFIARMRASRVSPFMEKMKARKAIPLIQLSLNSLNADQILDLAHQNALDIDIFAINKSSTQNKHHDVKLIRQLKHEFPNKQVLVEITAIDDAKPFYQAGADICTLSGKYGVQDIADVTKVAKDYNAKVQVDLTNVSNKINVAKKCAILGVDTISVNPRLETQITGQSPTADIQAIVNRNIPVQISATSSISKSTARSKAQRVARAGADILEVNARVVPPISHATPKPVIVEPFPSEPALRVRLSGDKTRKWVVERGSNCLLTVDIGMLNDSSTLYEITGKTLKKARQAKLEVVFVLYSGSFAVQNGKTRIVTKFKDYGFETPVEFHLTAPIKPQEKSTVYLEMEIHGLPAVRIAIELNLVNDIKSLPAEAVAINLLQKLDLDKLIRQLELSAEPNGILRKPDAILRINSVREQSSAELEILAQPFNISCNSAALNNVSISRKCFKAAKEINAIANDPVWLELADPLNPTSTEKALLNYPLARVAAAGYQLYKWLAESASMEGILEYINNLPPGSYIRVRNDNVSIPWEMIYPYPFYIDSFKDDGVNRVDPTKFWGYRFLFETLLTPATHQLPIGNMADLIDRHCLAARTLTAVLNFEIDKEIPTWIAGKPVTYQQDAFTRAIIDKQLQKVQMNIDCITTKNMVRDKNTASSFIYFYCHGSSAENVDMDELLQLSEDCELTVGDMSNDKTFDNAPIVFLNSCSSGPLVSLSFDSFCAGFLRKGALGLITTAFSVPAPFAARFGCKLILSYMRGNSSLGELLLKLRKEALDAHIPIGLFYLLRCPAYISLSE